MKIVLVLGSPRPSSDSTAISEAAAEAFPGADKEITKFVINKLNGKGCQACSSCKGKTETCVIKDDIAQVLAAAKEADLLVVASPIYIGEVTAQAKIFIDRAYSWYKPDFYTNPNPSRLKPGKKAILVFTQGNPDLKTYSGYVFKHYEDYFKSLGFKVGIVAAAIPPTGEAHDKAVSEAKKEAARLAASI